MRSKLFLKDIYMGSDGYSFPKEFVEYLQDVLDNGNWIAMSDIQHIS